MKNKLFYLLTTGVVFKSVVTVYSTETQSIQFNLLTIKHRIMISKLLFSILIALFSFTANAQLNSDAKSVLDSNLDYRYAFEAAYIEYPNLPFGILEALSYTTTRLSHRIPNHTTINCSGNPHFYGLMGLVEDEKFNSSISIASLSKAYNFDKDEIKRNPKTNVMAVAKWINDKATNKANATLDVYLTILMDYSGIPDKGETEEFLRTDFAYQIVSSMISGIKANGIEYRKPDRNLKLLNFFPEEHLRKYSTGKITIEKQNNNNAEKNDESTTFSRTMSSDYPNAQWVGTGCYSSRNGTAITDVVVHDMEGYFTYTVYTHFQNCDYQVSSHYAIRSSDGFLVQLVDEADKAWHIGAANYYSIGIEHEGFANNSVWYTDEMYQSSADLVKDITQSGYGIDPESCYNGPSNQNGQLDPQPTSTRIKGHGHYPVGINVNSHYDPGVNWDWPYYYDLINGSSSNDNIPDIVIEEMWTVPANPVAGEEVDLYVKIKVLNAESNSGSLVYKIDGSTVGSDGTPSLEINEEATEYLSNYIFISSGTYQFCVYVDPVDGEEYTANNSYCINIYVSDANNSNDETNVYLSNASLSTIIVPQGGSYEVNVSQCVETATTNSDLNNPNLAYFTNNACSISGGNEEGGDSSGIGSDDPCDEESKTITVSENTAPGTYVLVIIADYENEIEESDEGDNYICLEYEVVEATEEDIYIDNATLSSIDVIAGGNLTAGCDVIYTGSVLNENLPNINTGYLLKSTCSNTESVYLGGDSSGVGYYEPIVGETETITIPEDTPAGPYVIVFQADYNQELEESNEDNNDDVCIEINVTQPLSIGENALKNSISIYPNPTEGNLIISNPKFLDINKIEVYDIVGSKVLDFKYPNNNISIENLQSGTYFLNVRLENGAQSTYKIIKL
ncbi:MAG: T9SS type A sorting domain-containing protein [Deltaproteobacteria bacterium]|nr:T9SS type A sorting domain-containing protein [Deltaproteobacteria bacterium]